MFDQNEYRNACDRLTLGAEKLEEMIAMTEKKTKAPKRALRVALIAAACVAALTVTAFAAVPAVRDFFTSYTVTFKTGDDAAPITVPAMSLTQRDGRDVLTVDGEDVDVTDAFAQEGNYVFEQDGATITVSADGWVDIITDESDPISYSFNLLGKDRASATDDPEEPAELPHPNGADQEQYTVLPGPDGGMYIYNGQGDLVDVDLPSSTDVPLE